MKIDSHQHFWNPTRGDYGWMDDAGLDHLRKAILPPDFALHRTQFGIDKTIVVQAAPTLHETEYLLGLADCTPFIAKIVGWVDFENREDVRHLQRLSKHPKFSGVRPMIQDIADPNWMHRADVQWAYDAIIDLDLTFDALGFPLHIENFQRLCDRYPTMRTVIDHGMKPRIRDGAFDNWAKGMAKLAATTPSYCKLSGLATEAATGWGIETLAPYVTHLVASFGAQRLMWGSDWPVLELNGTYEKWHNAAQKMIAPAETSQIFGGTAAEFYRLND
jgi:L-fuconolactonase